MLTKRFRMGLSTQQMMRLASFPKSTLVGAVHRSERGRRTPTGLQTPASDPDRLTAEAQCVIGRTGIATGAQAEVEAVRPCHHHLWGVEMGTVIESLIRRNGQNVLKLVAIADGLNNSQVSRDHRLCPGHRGGKTPLEIDIHSFIDLRIIFNPSSSNAGNNRMKLNPKSAPPLPPNSSDLSPPNCLGLHPNQQFSSGLATELPPLNFRSNGLPKTNLVASTLSLPYAMDASDTQSMAENLTKLLPSHPHSENIDYMPSVESTEKNQCPQPIILNPPQTYEATLMFGMIEYIVKANKSLLPVLKHVGPVSGPRIWVGLGKPWEFWKSEIRKKYGNSLRKRNMQISFEKDKFNPTFYKPAEWCLKQKERLFAFSPELSEEDIVFKILYQCDGNIEHAVKSRLKEALDYDEMVNIMEEVIDRTKIGRNARNNKDYTKYKQDNNSNTAPKTKSPTIEKKEYTSSGQKTCYNCKQKGHTANKCPKKNNKNVNLIEGSDSENQENEEIAQDSEKYAQDNEFSEEIEEQYLDHRINAVEVIFPEEMEVAQIQGESSLPQVWENTNPINHISDERLMKSRPEKGKAYMIGKTCMTKAFLDNKEVKCLLDGGAFCSIVGQNKKPTDEFIRFDNMLSECKISAEIDMNQMNDLKQVLFKNQKAFSSEKNHLGKIINHEIKITLNINKPYPPLLKRQPYPASAKSREALATQGFRSI
ncbi:hypothetical protein PPACK8108_LOCUS5862 [Phakopsora pachyrhizi]|uniref:CCHC-type domain-containing protein n=1 Tax=Phakopsora pachyrhizi TaxID=170000 RepID=A0AAV0ATT5_PHAPC|nr:hypothetical protein PPACK8108_LOCUS5862 [Phakopsora pachyrhizi]